MQVNTENTAEGTTQTYLQLISKDEKAVKIEGLQIKAQEASLEVSRAIMNLKSEIAQKTSQISAIQRQIPYSVQDEFKATKELAILNDRLEFAQGIKDTRFSDAVI